MIQKIHHIGIAVPDLDAELPFYRDVMGLHLESIEELQQDKIRVAIFVIGETYLEIMEPLTDDSPVARYLQKRGPGFHHLAYQVDNTQKTIDHLQQNNVRMVDNTPREGAHAMQIAFAHPKATSGVLTEFCSYKESVAYQISPNKKSKTIVDN